MRTPRFFATSVAIALVLASGRHAYAKESYGARALVVLIGSAGGSDELRSVLSELLEREGVAVEYERRPHFSQSALLSESRDTRVWVFVSKPGPHVAKLYFRGPSGERFLLRQLSLKNGLDELGRELIGQVVETSTAALLHSNAGVSREEARAGLSAEDRDDDASGGDDATDAKMEPSSDTSAVDRDAKRPGRTRLEYELDARTFAKWAGPALGVDHGVGLDAALAFRFSPALFLRARVGIEYGFGQSIETAELDADVRATSLRAGIDVGTAFGVNAFSVGALAGADFTKTVPKESATPDLVLAGESSATVPMIRLEARYELALGAFRATAGAFADGALAETRYDVRDAGGRQHVASPWAVRPGVALTVGFRSSL